MNRGAGLASVSRTYEVKRGDTLGKIAEQYYGDPSLYKQIYEANKELIKNPDLIQIGWKLRIP